MSTPLSLPRRQRPGHLPRLWFFTDMRLGGSEAALIARLPPGTGVVLRNYGIANRTAWAHALVALCKRRRLTVLVAGDDKLAWTLRADGVHWPEKQSRAQVRRRCKRWLVTMAVHGPGGVCVARHIHADAVFISPVFLTRSHPGRAGMGTVRAGLLIRQVLFPAIALGGVTSRSSRKVMTRKFYGLAAIDGWAALDGWRDAAGVN